MPYFAYGSNLGRAQMAHRCPAARATGVAELSGWRFLINARGCATIVPDPECRVHGLVWDLTADCEAALDAYEGVSHGIYTKEVMAVGGSEALVYLAANTRPGHPRPGYRSVFSPPPLCWIFRLHTASSLRLGSWLSVSASARRPSTPFQQDQHAMKIVALTGAGISAESGLGTFRDKGGLWERYDPMELATPEAFARDPATVQAFYNARRQTCSHRSPTRRIGRWPGWRKGWRLAATSSRSSPRTSMICMSGPAPAVFSTCMASY